MQTPRRPQRFHARRAGFTLVELLVVIGIIGLLIAILMPALSKAQRQAKQVQCQSNLRQVGVYLTTYMNQWKGWVFPPALGSDKPRDQRWPVHVFKPAVWNPPILLCPSDLEGAEEHSYLLNDHLVLNHVKYSSKNLGGKTPSDVVVMGEKRSERTDYYMNKNDFDTRVEPYRHGLQLGSNYLYLDMHVDTRPPKEALNGIDPWDVPTSQPSH